MNDVVCVRDEYVIVEIFIYCKKSLRMGGGVKINFIFVFCEDLIYIIIDCFNFVFFWFYV